MLRFVISPDDRVIPDLYGKLPGRGLWLTADRDIIHAACAQNVFAKRARRQVNVDEDLAQRVEVLLAKRCTDLLQLARRAGVLTVGSDEVDSRLSGGVKGLLLVATDAASKSRRRISELASSLAVRDVLSADELGAVVGRERVVHALVSEGGIADLLARDLGRLAGFRPTLVAA